MTNPPSIPSHEATPNQKNAWESALRFCLAGALFFLSIPALGVFLVAGKMQQIFEEILGGKPLPGITVLVFNYRGGLIVATALLAVLSIIGVLKLKGRASVILTGVVSLILLLGGFLMVLCAYFLPMTGIIMHMGEDF